MHVEMENVIKKLEQYIKDDEVTYEFDDAIEELKNLTSILGDKNSLIKVDHDGRLESLC